MNAPLLPALPGYDDPQLIAHGTTALVFRAVQTRLNRAVAIKVITADTGSGSVPVNVERELATTVALSSQPHIVSIIDTGVTTDERRYIVMEYCEGGSYAQILRQQGPLPIDDVVEVGIKIGQALHAAHEAGIVHRDVKPSNLLRSRFGPALTDFGISRAPNELGGTLTREMMTPHHASPEALLHQAQSGLSDVYSLASTMWTLLVGHPPFVDPAQPDMDMYTFRDRVLHERLPPMPRADVPAWLVAELSRAMAKLPVQRHGSALEFSEALQRGTLGVADAAAPVPRRPADSAPPPGPFSVPAPPAPPVPASAAMPAQPMRAPPRPDRVAPPPRPPAGAPGPSPAAPVAVGPAPLIAPAPLEPGPLVEPGPIYRPRPGGARPPLTTHTLGQPGPPVVEPDSPVAEPGSRPRARPDTPEAPTADEPVPARGRAITERGRRRRGGLVTLIAGLTLAASALGAVVFVQSRPDPQDAPLAGASVAPDPSASPSPIVPAGPDGAPTDLRITDDLGTSVTLAWTDPTGGEQAYVAVQIEPNPDDSRTHTIPRGGADKTVTFAGLAPDRDYCFTVGVVQTIGKLPFATEVCTVR